LPRSPGHERVLVKVENGLGGWALIVEAYAGKEADRILAEIKAEEDARAFQRQELGLATAWPGYAFWPGWGGIPRIIWRDADTVRKLVGDVPLTVRWYDSDLNEAADPQKPGRYAAYVESKMKDGTPIRRAMTFFCDRSGLDVWHDLKLQAPYPGKPVDPEAWKERTNSRRRTRRTLQGLCEHPDGAIMLAAPLVADWQEAHGH
jgi:hypothetical protein